MSVISYNLYLIDHFIFKSFSIFHVEVYGILHRCDFYKNLESAKSV
jgi:hypothetical protein